MKTYNELKQFILEQIPESFRADDFFAEKIYTPFKCMTNFDPYRNHGAMFPAIVEWHYLEENCNHQMRKGQDRTVFLWDAIIRYKEYDLLADLFILCFFFDYTKLCVDLGFPISVCNEYVKTARIILKENDYCEYHSASNRYLPSAMWLSPTYQSLREQARERLRRGEDVPNKTELVYNSIIQIIKELFAPYSISIYRPDSRVIKEIQESVQRSHAEFLDSLFGIPYDDFLKICDVTDCEREEAKNDDEQQAVDMRFMSRIMNYGKHSGEEKFCIGNKRQN